jgi:hypothetical protein
MYPFFTMAVWFFYLVTAYCLLANCSPFPTSQETTTTTDDDLPNANHIFNAIHSSMRQWGSSRKHNGMSFFLANVPAGVQLYHGRFEPNPVKGMEWVAFEPEHALYFATKTSPPSDDDTVKAHHHTTQVSMENLLQTAGFKGAQIHPPYAGRYPLQPGWLHTYITKETLPLLYIDGSSAGKSPIGTLDTQDILLLNATDPSSDHRGYREFERAEALCTLSKTQWNGKIKGFIRMEAGFEIIICSFERDLDFVRAIRAGPRFPSSDNDGRPIWNWLKPISARYDGIGGERVKVNYNKFVTAFNRDLALFKDKQRFPRLTNVSQTSLNRIRGDLNNLITTWDGRVDERINWQSIADMVVDRYADELKYLVFGSFMRREDLLHELSRILRNFIDIDDSSNRTAEIDRCVRQSIPVIEEDTKPIAHRAVESVTSRICSTLFAQLDTDRSLSESIEELEALMTYLDWTVWQRCSECPLDRICFTPMWPFGSKEDYNHPRCLNETEMGNRFGYWDDRHPRDQANQEL